MPDSSAKMIGVAAAACGVGCGVGFLAGRHCEKLQSEKPSSEARRRLSSFGGKLDAAVVIDPYSSGRFLLYELKKRDMPIICVRSTYDVGVFFKRVYDSHLEYFDEKLDFPEFGFDYAKLVEAIKDLPYNIVAVLPGSDAGVELAEHVSEIMQMPTTNGTELLFQRIDKAAMQDQLRKCGVPAAEQIKSGKVEELVEWATKRNKWPVVAKPAGGVGSEGIYFCKSVDDIKKAQKEIIGVLNPKGVKNDAVALQEFLKGEEYIVDCISHKGKHICVAIWYQGKRRDLPWNPTSIITTYNELLEPKGKEQDALVDYTFKMLDAVGFKNGISHNELMFTERGPILIEINARMHGVQAPGLVEMATGTNLADYACDIYVGECRKFKKLYKPPPAERFLYPVQKQCFQLVLCCPFTGYYKESLKERILALDLPSCIEVLTAKGVGDFQPQSIDLPTSPGTILMVHESRKQLEEDMKKVRAAEMDSTDGIYLLVERKGSIAGRVSTAELGGA